MRSRTMLLAPALLAVAALLTGCQSQSVIGSVTADMQTTAPIGDPAALEGGDTSPATLSINAGAIPQKDGSVKIRVQSGMYSHSDANVAFTLRSMKPTLLADLPIGVQQRVRTAGARDMCSFLVAEYDSIIAGKPGSGYVLLGLGAPARGAEYPAVIGVMGLSGPYGPEEVGPTAHTGTDYFAVGNVTSGTLRINGGKTGYCNNN